MDDETNVIQTSFDKDTHELTDEPEERGAGTFDMKDHEVRALGHNENHFFYYSSEKAMVVSLSAKSHGALDLLGMANELYWATRCGFSMAGAKPDKIPWQKLADSMMSQCRKVGFFSADNIRGRGAWFDRGRSFFHVGDRLIVDGTEVNLSDVDSKYIYTRRKQMRDFDLSERLSDGDCRKIVELCRRFRWYSPLHANLLAGWIGHASICGASDWRAHVWLTGPTMSGKSTIATGFLHPLLGSDSAEFYQSAETTEAGIRQHMGCDSVPVIFDEFEADNKAVQAKVERVLSLMRQASSETAGKIIKGTALGEATPPADCRR